MMDKSNYMKSSFLLSIDQISTRLTSRFSAGRDLDSFARGLRELFIPRNKQEYDLYRRYMHDILCLSLLDSNYYDMENFELANLGLQSNDNQFNKYKPDLYRIEMDVIRVCDVSFTLDPKQTTHEKRQKYEQYLDFVSTKLDKRIDFRVLCIDLTDAEWQDHIPQISSMYMGMIERFVNNLRQIHASPRGISYRQQSTKKASYAIDRFTFKADDSHMSGLIQSITGSPDKYQSFNEMIRTQSYAKDNLTNDEYMTELAGNILKSERFARPRPHPDPLTPVHLIKDWLSFKSKPKTTEKIPVVLQLGCPNLTDEIEESFEESVGFLLHTQSHGGYLDYIKQSISTKTPDSTRLIIMHLTDQMKREEMMEGPGRKSYIKKFGLKSERSSPTHIGIDNQHQVILGDLMHRVDSPDPSDFVRDIDLPSSDYTGGSMHNNLIRIYNLLMSSGTTFLLRFYQKLSQEIILCSMRRRKRNEYILGYSGFKGIYFLVAPGPQLRTESNTIFIKIVSMCSPIVHQLVANWHPQGDHWESSWLSVDTDRLKHWCRSFDRVSLSLLGCSERLVEPGLNMLEACRQEMKELNYSLMALTYLENKQLTSTTNQSIRYLWMKSIGDRQFKGIIGKFPDRVSSVIQSTMMQRSVKTTIEVCSKSLSAYLKSNQLYRDEDLGSLDESTTGIVGKLPRLFTNGSMVPLSYNLNEIYWCMMYNKDRQNVTQDSMKILSKIMREEVKFDEEINSREPDQKYNYFMGITSLTEDLNHVKSSKPESHYFSMRAVSIGIEEQDKHPENTCPSSTWLTDSKITDLLNKNMSEYATFKASVNSIKHKIAKEEIDEINEIGKRTKCIELVYQMVKDENLRTASEVAMQYSGLNSANFETCIQIFKKNQIGGVREILILYVKARVMINIIEEICRMLSKADKREILTKGKDKRLMMRNDYEDLSSSFPKGTPLQIVRNSYDMSTWCQKFIPTVFVPIFSKHIKNDSLLEYCNFILLKHCDKSIELPRKLVEQWSKHPEMIHEEPHMQEFKERFLQDGSVSFKNRSNMGQGILHYCSTVLALSAQSFRDALFKKCLNLLSVTSKIQWKTRVGSDDKGELVAIDMSDKQSYAQYLLFEHCSHVAERLHAMELSVKSASGTVIYELNSAFMANLETLSPTMKFTMAATDMIATNSCTRFVNESYSRIRQLRENGASSLVCGYAHIMNSDHFYQIFRTGEMMTNDPRSIFGLTDKLIPYDFGIYPFYDIDIQDMIGPEFHNYLVYTDKRCSESMLKFLYTELSTNNTGEFLPDDSTPLYKKDHFGINQGLIRQLVNMRQRLNLDPQSILEYLKKNPFMIVRGPENLEETANIIASKLYTKGASESLRRTSPAIYMGRLSAFETAKAWSIALEPAEDTDESQDAYQNDEEVSLINRRTIINLTYQDYLKKGFEMANNDKSDFNKLEYMDLIFPQSQSFEVVRQFVGKFGPRQENKKKHSQAVRTWTLNNYNYNFSNSLRSILETSFGYSSNSTMDDVHELRKLIGLDLSSYESLIEDCEAKGVRPLDLFFYMSKLFKNIGISRPQVFASGPSTTTLNLTLLNIKRYNHLPNSTMYIDEGVDEDISYKSNTIDKTIDTIKFAFNIRMMELQGNLIHDSHNLMSDITLQDGKSLSDFCTTALRSIRSISGFDQQTRKILTFLSSELLTQQEFKERLLRWKTLNYSYIKTQTKVFDSLGRSSWVGDLILLVNSGVDCFTINSSTSGNLIKSLRLTDLDSLYRNLQELCRLLQFDFRSFFIKRKSHIGDIYLKSKKLYRCQVNGDLLDVLKSEESVSFEYNRLQDFDTFTVCKKFSKDGSMHVFLQDDKHKSATICHFPGHYYPTPVPNSVRIPEGCWLLGVRFSKLMENPDWFFNARLPVMTNKAASEFLKKDVMLDVVMKQNQTVKTRIADYISLHEEINEEAFSFNVDSEYLNRSLKPHKMLANDQIAGRTFFDMFQDEFENQIENADDWNSPIENWADMVEEQDAEDLDQLAGGTLAEEGTAFARALGMKKPTKRKNFFQISNLQQGSLIRTRILDMFFSSGSILSENRSNLPYYCIWLMRTDTKLDDELKLSLIKHMKEYMVYTTGASMQKIESVLLSANTTLAKPIERVQLFMIDSQEETLWELIDQNNEKYMVEDSDIDEDEI